jgi:hypothetical protein
VSVIIGKELKKVKKLGHPLKRIKEDPKGRASPGKN